MNASQTLSRSRRRIGILIALAATVLWTGFAVKSGKKRYIYPPVPPSVRVLVDKHVEAEAAHGAAFIHVPDPEKAVLQ